MSKTKRIQAVLLSILIVMSVVCGCQKSNAKPVSKEAKTVIFVDSAGRKVQVPEKITRIAPSGALAQIVTFALAPDKFVGLSGKWGAKSELFLDKKYLELPVFGQFYGSGDLNIEAVAKADPQVIIDIGEIKDSTVKDLDTVMKQTGIPTIFIEAKTAAMPDVYRMLGKLLNMEKEAEVLAAYCDEVYTGASNLSKKLGDKKTTLAYCQGDAGLNIIAEGSFHAEVINLLSNNVAVVNNPSSKGTGNEVSMEQLMLWDPECIIFAPNSIYSTAANNPAWQKLKAIKTGKYCEVPVVPYNWLGFPPSVNRYIGMIWMSELLYPEQSDYDLYKETARYYKLFYHCKLSKDLFAEITKNSSFKH